MESPELTPISIEQERLNLEERRVKADEERVAIEREKATFERHWTNRVLSVLTPLLPVLVTGILSVAGIWIAHIWKSKELEIARVQEDKELAVARTQREKELDNLQAQQQREWNLEVAKFVTEHANVIFGGNREEQKRVAKIIAVTFPPQISDALLQKLEVTHPKINNGAPSTWEQARNELNRKDSAHVVFGVRNEVEGTGVVGAHVVFTNADNESTFEAMTDNYGRGMIDLPVTAGGSYYRVMIARNGYEPKNEVASYMPGKNNSGFTIAPLTATQ